jgi:hypothetical protein
MYADLVRAADAQADDAECWKRAEWHLLGKAFEEQLARLDLDATPSAGAMLIAAALFLCEHTEEWGGDARDVLGELAQLGRSLIQD